MPILPETIENLEMGRVHELNLSPYTIERADLKLIIEHLPANKNMKAMLLGSSRFDRDMVEMLAEAIAAHPSLVEFSISANSEVGDAGARAFAKMMEVNQVLASMRLSKCSISNDGVRALARAVRKNHSLNILDLSGNVIGDDGAAAIAFALEGNKSLTSLKLEGNAIGYHGIQALVEALKGNQTLVEFTMVGNKGDEVLMRSFERAFEDSKNIINLKVSNSHVIGFCDENKKIAIEMFNKISNHNIKDLAAEDVKEIRGRIYSLMYVAEHDMRVPRYKILEVMAGFRRFSSRLEATA